MFVVRCFYFVIGQLALPNPETVWLVPNRWQSDHTPSKVYVLCEHKLSGLWEVQDGKQ